MSFDKMYAACNLVTAKTRHHERFHDWVAKRDAIAVLLRDLPMLVERHKNVEHKPYSGNSNITTCDPAPAIRLATACESISNVLYGLSEVAANFGNKASNGVLPSSFNTLRKNAQAGKLDPALLTALGDLQWYEKVRELRTEWAHYSSVFIGEDKTGEPVLVVRCYRRESDRKQFKNKIECTVQDIITWTTHAVLTIDGFAGYMLNKYVLPAFDLDGEVITPRYDSNGYPVMTTDHRFEVETITVRELLQRHRVIPR